MNKIILVFSACLLFLPLVSHSQFVENKGQISHREIFKLRPDIMFQIAGNNMISNYTGKGLENYYYEVRETPHDNWTEEMLNNEKMDRKVKMFFFLYL